MVVVVEEMIQSRKKRAGLKGMMPKKGVGKAVMRW
jgi:hypothetical protein